MRGIMERNKRWRKRQQKRETPNVAVYLDELDHAEVDIDQEYIDTVDTTEYEWRRPLEKMRKRQRRFSEKKAKKSKRKTFFLCFLVFLLLVQLPFILGIISAFRWQTFTTRSTIPDTKGILLLGVDNEGANSIKTGHTDSITYLAANFATKTAVSLPIYRDANIMQQCTGTPDNINRIYANHGIACLVESTSQFLELPIDYYAIVTIQGLIHIIDSLGRVEITPSGSYCSNYGEDGVTYCFIAGQTQAMTGAQALAYIRYRGGHSGETRANRQLELIYALKDHCLNNLLSCYVRATPELSQGVRTNIPLTEVFSIAEVFTDAFQMETLEVLAGRNQQIDGNWTQHVSIYDLATKRKFILQKVYHE